jgi:hypothetical protein
MTRYSAGGMVAILVGACASLGWGANPSTGFVSGLETPPTKGTGETVAILVGKVLKQVQHDGEAMGQAGWLRSWWGRC